MTNTEQIKRALAERQTAIAAARGFLDGITREKRGMTAEEKAKYESMDARISDIDANVASLRDFEERLKPRLEAALRGETVNGATVTLRPEQRMTDWMEQHGRIREEDREIDFGKLLRGMITGEWRGAELEQRAQAEGTVGAGGAMVPTPIVAGVLDKARNLSRVFQAGATTVPMDSATLKVARVTADPSGLAWTAENGSVPSNDFTLDQITLTAQTLPFIVKASRQVVEDATGLGAAVENALSSMLAVELDRAALRGSGSAPEPRGILNTSGINTLYVTATGTQSSAPAAGATPTTWNSLVDGKGEIRNANYEPSDVAILAPRTYKTFAKLTDTTNQYMARPFDLANTQLLTSNNVGITDTVGSSTDTSPVFFGDFGKLFIGIRDTLQIRVLEERYADNLQVAFLCWLRADVALARADAFTVIKGYR